MNRYILLAMMGLFIGLNASAQIVEQRQDLNDAFRRLRERQKEEQIKEQGYVPYEEVEQKPQFRGGNAFTFSYWVNSQTREFNKPVKNEDGSSSLSIVHLAFTVGADGKIKNVRVEKSSNETDFDNEAVRVVSSSPDWTPGYYNGKAVDVGFTTFPVEFYSKESLPKASTTTSSSSTGTQASTGEIAQNIQVSDLIGTVWERTKYGSSYKDKTIDQLQFIGTEHVREAGVMYLDDRLISDVAVVYKYSIINSTTIRVYFTAFTDKGKYHESYYDFRLKNQSGKYSLVDVTEHYSTHQEPYDFKFRHKLSLSVSPSFLSLSKGESASLDISVSPRNAYLSITSDNPDVAIVNSQGYVTAKDNGEAIITVKLGTMALSCKVVVKPPHIPVSSIVLNYNTLNLYPDESRALKVIVNLSNGKSTNEKEVNWTCDNPAVTVSSTGEITVASKAKTAMATITATCEDKSASCKVNILSGKRKTKTIVGAVDMGLSVKWASSNLEETGLANEPSDVGDLFAWGELATKAKFTWDSYKWTDGPVFQYPDDRTRRLKTEDDVASWKLGENWRIPTHEEFKELIDNCKIKPKILNHVTGLLFISNINGNSIFFPAPRETREGYLGNYWCSDMNFGGSRPWSMCLIFRALLSSPDYNFKEHPDPHSGFFVRPVLE